MSPNLLEIALRISLCPLYFIEEEIYATDTFLIIFSFRFLKPHERGMIITKNQRMLESIITVIEKTQNARLIASKPELSTRPIPCASAGTAGTTCIEESTRDKQANAIMRGANARLTYTPVDQYGIS
jgi:hypothetical protein